MKQNYIKENVDFQTKNLFLFKTMNIIIAIGFDLKVILPRNLLLNYFFGETFVEKISFKENLFCRRSLQFCGEIILGENLFFFNENMRNFSHS